MKYYAMDMQGNYYVQEYIMALGNYHLKPNYQMRTVKIVVLSDL